MGITYSVGEVDHLYTFFAQWSPDIYTKNTKERSFLVVDKDNLTVIDNLLNGPVSKQWEIIITVTEPKGRQSVSSSEGEDTDDLLPTLQHLSHILEGHHLAMLTNHMPARTRGSPWHLAYSTAEHGTSLRTLYRKMGHLDRPVLLVIKDMNKQVFGAFSSHPFRVSSSCYGTGETFLYSFSPEFKLFRWSGENSYFVRGFYDSLQMGAGGGHFGLWLDADLNRGSSYPCNTFHNQPLSSHHDFTVNDLEVWTFH